MDIQLQELIDKIKKDGIESASNLATTMQQEAEEKARAIVDAAKREADSIISGAKTDAQRFEQAGKAALEQASRNLVLAFKSEIQTLLDTIVAKNVSETLDKDCLKNIVPGLVRTWAEGSSDELQVLLNEKDLAQLEDFFRKELANELKKGLVLDSDRNLPGGFRIASKDGSAYYDFSAEAVAGLLSSYLNPKIAEIMLSAVREQ